MQFKIRPDEDPQPNAVFSTQGWDNMNATEPGFLFTFNPSNLNATLWNLTGTAVSSATSQSPTHPSPSHDPEFTIMVVLGLSLLLAGLAAFLAVCRPSEPDGDSDASCGPGESLTSGRRSRSSEPQLKVWKRLGSYRRSYNLSFRRPPYRRPHERESTQTSPARQTPQPEAGVEPHFTVPCLFDYVTEIWLKDPQSWLIAPQNKVLHCTFHCWCFSTTNIQCKMHKENTYFAS